MSTGESRTRFAVAVKLDHESSEWDWGIAGVDGVWSGSVAARGREDAIICAIQVVIRDLTADGDAVVVVSLPENARFWMLTDDLANYFRGIVVAPYTEEDADLRSLAMAALDGYPVGPLPTLTVATDGAARHGRIGWGWLAGDGQHGCGANKPHPLECAASCLAVVAELQAISRAVSDLPGRDLVIRTDSKSALALVQDWILGVDRVPSGYRASDARAARKGGLLWMQKQMRREAGRIRIEWVRGHVGDPLNEGADSLAKLARRHLEPSWGIADEDVPKRASEIASYFARAAAEPAAA